MTNICENMVFTDTESSLIEGFEPKDNEKNYYIRGKFATIEQVNNNKRFYPRHLWEREVLRYQEEIKNGTINTLMEWDHPEDRLDVDPSKAIGKITKLWIDGNYVMGEAVLFDVPMAATLRAMIKYGVQISVSSRARGRTDSSGVVQEFELITFDFVAKPSDKNATMHGIFEKLEELKTQNTDHNLKIIDDMVESMYQKDLDIMALTEEVEYLRKLNRERQKLNESENTVIINGEPYNFDKDFKYITWYLDEVCLWKDKPKFIPEIEGFASNQKPKYIGATILNQVPEEELDLKGHLCLSKIEGTLNLDKQLQKTNIIKQIEVY